MRKAFFTLFLLLPAVMFALEYTDPNTRYADAPFSTAESAGIGLLTKEGAVNGDPSGRFVPGRTLNRAELLKIVLLASDTLSAESQMRDCFPDVRRTDWFSLFVCAAKDAETVQGNPDGTFQPGRTVPLAEAVTMAVRAWNLPLPVYFRAPDHWYDPYMDAAQNYGIIPAGIGGPETLLTRGAAARLIASFYAYGHGELENYRRAERGLPPIGSSSSSSSVSSSSSSSTSVSSMSSSSTSSVPSSSSSSSASSVSDTNGFPARSRFLVAGERSEPVASATFFANLEPMYVKRAEVVLMDEIEGIDAMFIVDRDGVQLGQIYLDKVFDSTKRTWRGTLSGTGTYKIEKGQQKVIGVEIRMKPRDAGGTSEEMVEVDTFKLTTEGEWSTDTTTSGPNPGPFPKHQTSMGRIVSVRNAQEETGILPIGPASMLGSFMIDGYAVNPVTLKIEHLEFQVSGSSSVNVSNWQLGIADSNERHACTFNSNIVSCNTLPDSLGTLGGGSRVFRLYGDVTLNSGSSSKEYQVSLNLAGDLSTLGAVRWTDQTGHFNWVELDQPLARSTLWQ